MLSLFRACGDAIQTANVKTYAGHLMYNVFWGQFRRDINKLQMVFHWNNRAKVYF